MDREKYAKTLKDRSEKLKVFYDRGRTLHEMTKSAAATIKAAEGDIEKFKQMVVDERADLDVLNDAAYKIEYYASEVGDMVEQAFVNLKKIMDGYMEECKSTSIGIEKRSREFNEMIGSAVEKVNGPRPNQVD